MKLMIGAILVATIAVPALAKDEPAQARSPNGASHWRVSDDFRRKPAYVAGQPDTTCLTENVSGRVVCHSIAEWRAIAARIDRRAQGR